MSLLLKKSIRQRNPSQRQCALLACQCLPIFHFTPRQMMLFASSGEICRMLLCPRNARPRTQHLTKSLHATMNLRIGDA